MLSALRDKNTASMVEMARLRRQYSGRRGEKVDPAQLQLMLSMLDDEDMAEPDNDEPADDSIDSMIAQKDDGPKRKPRRKKPSKALEREPVFHQLGEDDRRCTQCNEVMPKIGEDVSELLGDRSAKPEDLAGAVWQGLVSADSVGAKKRRQCCRGGGVRPGQPAWERA
jgi:hypothetical protein